MPKPFIESQTFKDQDYTASPLPLAEYEDCRFVNCKLAAANLSDMAFVECTFEGCDLSNAILPANRFCANIII